MTAPTLKACRIEQITSHHPKLSSLLVDLDLPPLAVGYGKELTPAALKTLLEIYPIRVMSHSNHTYRCIGGIRQWLLAQAMLQPKDSIAVLVYPKKKVDVQSMQRQLLVELYHMPLMMGLMQGDTRMAGTMVKNLKDGKDESLSDVLLELGLGTQKMQSYWSGVSERTLKRG